MFKCVSGQSVLVVKSSSRQPTSGSGQLNVSHTQTDPISFNSVPVQTTERQDAQVQSCSTEPASAVSQKLLESSLEAQDPSSLFKRLQKSEIDKLTTFLRHVEPFVSRALMYSANRAQSSQKPFAMKPMGEQMRDTLTMNSDNNALGVRHLLYPATVLANQPTTTTSGGIGANGPSSSSAPRLAPLQLKFTGLRLRSYLYIALGYPSHDEEGWCSHRGYLVGWDLSVPVQRVHCTRPDLVLETTSCLGCISVHPNDQNLVAGGTFSGDVLLWDMRQLDMGKDALVFSSETITTKSMNTQVKQSLDLDAVEGGNEPVVAVHWLPSAQQGSTGRMLLISAQRNGVLSVFQVDTQTHAVQLVKRFSVANVVDVFRSMQPDVTCMAVDSNWDPLVGTRNGSVYLGTNSGHVLALDIPALLHQQQLTANKPFTLFSNSGINKTPSSALSTTPRSVSFLKNKGAPHAGPVTTLSVHSGFLASGSSDGRVLIWHTLKPHSPQFTIYPSANIGRSIQSVELERTSESAARGLMEVWVQDDRCQVAQYRLKPIVASTSSVGGMDENNQDGVQVKHVLNCAIKRSVEDELRFQGGVMDVSQLVDFEDVDGGETMMAGAGNKLTNASTTRGGGSSTAHLNGALSMSTSSRVMIAVGDGRGRILVLNRPSE